MTWGEFVKHVESNGVTENTIIDLIDTQEIDVNRVYLYWEKDGSVTIS